MSTATTMTCSLTGGWTNATENYSTAIGGALGGDYWQRWSWWPDYHYHYYTPYIQPITIERDVKVTLKFSEVDRLRKAAQKDEKLKAVLEKLTPCIEVVVDLDEQMRER